MKLIYARSKNHEQELLRAYFCIDIKYVYIC